jgi:hypothetical protein
LLLRHLFQSFNSRYHEAVFSQRRRAWATPATRLSGNAETFAVMPHARREKTEVSSKNVCAIGEASGIRRDTDGDYQKKSYMQKITNEAATPANAVQQLSVKAMAKFIVISFPGREQAVVFPVEIQHAAMLAKMQKAHGDVKPISAGFFMGDVAALWAGGESSSLELPSRTQDVEIIRAFLTSPTPEFNFMAGGVQ